MTYSRFTNEEIVSAYCETGSVWKAGRKLGLAGQTVHGRLRGIGHPIRSSWLPEEEERISELAGSATIGQIADELGRSYASIACKINEMGVGSRHGNRIKRKIPRGAGFDKVSVSKYIKEIEASKIPITKWARQRGMLVDSLVLAIEKHHPAWWIEYRGKISYLPEATCPNCKSKFYPSNTKQVCCSRQCTSRHRTNKDYFGGKRGTTIGLASGTCQCCGRHPKKGLSSHHVFGKENDPDNDCLVALCARCHNVITALGAVNFDERQWEAIISFSWLRKHGDDPECRRKALHVCVEIDSYEPEDDKEDPSVEMAA